MMDRGFAERVLDVLPQIVFAIDADYRVQHVNEAWNVLATRMNLTYLHEPTPGTVSVFDRLDVPWQNYFRDIYECLWNGELAYFAESFSFKWPGKDRETHYDLYIVRSGDVLVHVASDITRHVERLRNG